jgi:hypothetical protein|tara:strand:- start:183 stop:317 length:135 start_codon:yes stop_codon:yes gene_type:complete
MNNKTKGSIIIVLAMLVFFSKHEYAWIMSAALLGVGSGIFLWKK